MAGGFLNIAVPAGPQRPGGLLSVLTKNDLVHDGPGQIGAGITYDVASCAPALPAPGLCDTAAEMEPWDEKVFQSPGGDESNPFAIHYGVECLPGQYDYEALARDGLTSGQSFALGLGLKAIILDGADDLIGDPVSVRDGLAIAEQSQGETNYGPRFITTSRYGASYLSGYRGVVDAGDLLYTRQGTPIINEDALYVAGSPSPAGAPFLIYVHSPIHLYLGAIETTKGYDLTHNVETAIAERVAVFTNPCWLYSIEIDPTL